MINIKFNMILRIFFLKLSNADILFDKKTFTQKFYITNKALFTTKHIQIIDKIDFTKVVSDANSKTLLCMWSSKNKKKWLQILSKKSRLRPKSNRKKRFKLKLKLK